MRDIFEKALLGRSLFKNRDVLRFDYIPQKLPFRDEQITTMAQTVSPLLRGSKCSNLLIYGKTGTGKTAVVKHVLRTLQNMTYNPQINIKLAYCNTRDAGTEYRCLYELARYINLQLPFTGLSLGEAFDRILTNIQTASTRIIYILDEIDFLVKNFGDNILYELTRAGDRLKAGSVSLVGISNDLKFKEFLDPRVVSSLSEEELLFQPYNAEELRIILHDRANIAFHSETISNGTINMCAALAASEHGDARRAVDLLRVAGEVAERQGSNTIEEHHVHLALQKIDQDRTINALKSLPLHQKIVLLSLFGGSKSSTGALYTTYTSHCNHLAIEPLTSRRVSGLLSELDLLGLISVNVVSSGRYGRTKNINPLITQESITEIFEDDILLHPLLDRKTKPT